MTTSGKKKKVLFQTDFSLAKTGFGRNAKAVLSYLYKTNKYDIVHYCAGMRENNPSLSRTPWKSIGAIPTDPFVVEKIEQDEEAMKLAVYGNYRLDEVINSEKPDIYIAAQDIWGIDFAVKKPWFNKISSVFWTTLDSLPILPSAVQLGDQVENYWVWSSFATNALHEHGHNHVRTVHGPIESQYFYRFSDEKRELRRKSLNIPQDSFIIGFVFRNQLRKSVPNLLQGYKLWKEKQKPVRPTFLYLHTDFGEGWNILERADEFGVSHKEIICTYVCDSCKNYDVGQFRGLGVECPFCGEKKSMSTISPQNAVTEKELNEIYNIMDVYVHPFTSGGQEIPIQEAKLTELVTLVTNYSCGEEMCQKDAYSIPLEWFEYREPGTEFIKASTDPESIAEGLFLAYSMSKDKIRDMGKKARDWTLENYSIDSIGPKLEEFLDDCPFTNYDFPENEEEEEKISIEDMLSDDDKGRRILYVIPRTERDVFLSTSLFKSIKEQYPDHNLYVATEKAFFPVLDGNPHVHRVLEYSPQMDNLFWLEGRGDHDGYFEIAFLPHVNTQRMITFPHNGKDKIAFNLT